MRHPAYTHYPVDDPAPHEHRVGWALWAALLAPAIAWFVQLSVNYGIASHACFPRATLLNSPLDWSIGWPTILAMNVGTLAIAAFAIVISLVHWRRTRGEAAGGHGHLIEAGEGRTRFLAVWGTWAGVWFLIAILFDTIALYGVPPCGQ